MEPDNFMQRKASMKEIRVRWRLGLHEDDDGNPTDGGIWFPDSVRRPSASCRELSSTGVYVGEGQLRRQQTPRAWAPRSRQWPDAARGGRWPAVVEKPKSGGG